MVQLFKVISFPLTAETVVLAGTEPETALIPISILAGFATLTIRVKNSGFDPEAVVVLFIVMVFVDVLIALIAVLVGIPVPVILSVTRNPVTSESVMDVTPEPHEPVFE